MMTLILAVLFNITLVLICAFALTRGGKPERIGALLNLAGSFATGALQWFHAVSAALATSMTLTIDAGVALAFFWLAISTTRFWPIWAFGFALANLLVSVVAAMLPEVAPFIYHTGLVIYAYLALGALALGTYKLPRDADPVIRDGFRQSWIIRQQQRMS